MAGPIIAKSFKDLEDLIADKTKEIFLDSDIRISAENHSAIRIDVEELIIDGNMHAIDVGGSAGIFEVVKGEVTLKNLTLICTSQNPDAAIYNNDRLRIIDCKIETPQNGIYNGENAVLKLDGAIFGDTAGEITNDGTLIVINSSVNSIMNNNLLYLPDTECAAEKNGDNAGDDVDNGKGEAPEILDNILIANKSGNGRTLHFTKLNSKTEHSFSELQRWIDKYYDDHFRNVHHLFFNDDNEDLKTRLGHVWGSRDNLIRFKGNVVLDVYNDECFRFPDGIVVDEGGIIIDGQGYSIDSKGFSRPFTISARDVVIRNVTLTNGCSNVGGALKVSGGGVKLFSVTLENNHAFKNGGAVYNENGKITFKRVFFVNNEAEKGNAIYNDGEIIIDYGNFNDLKDNEMSIGDGDVQKHVNSRTDYCNAIFNIGKFILNDSKLAGKILIENNGILKIWNNSFEDTRIINQNHSLLKIYNRKPGKFDARRQSTMLKITNRGKVKAYDFENNQLPGDIDIPKDEVKYASTDVRSENVDDQKDIVVGKAQNLIGKKKDLRILDYFVQTQRNRILLIIGEEGIGKNTLLCKWYTQQTNSKYKPIIRLCETDKKSYTFKELYLSIGSEARIFEVDDEEINDNFIFDEDFFKKLKNKGIKVLILSNIDKLDEFNLGTVPSGFYLILSAGPEFWLYEEDKKVHERKAKENKIGEGENPDEAPDDKKAIEKQSYDFYKLKGFETSEERRSIIKKRLGKDLDKKQMKYLESRFLSESPLFIEIILRELKNSPSLDDLEIQVEGFGNSIPEAFGRLIEILESDESYPDGLVNTVLPLLAYSGNGLDRNSLLVALGYDEAQSAPLDEFLERIKYYRGENNGRYLIGYSDFRDAITARYSDADQYREKLVAIYRESLESSTASEYASITGSEDMLNQLELLGWHDRILDVFKNDALLDKISPDKYGLTYKRGKFFKNSDKKLGANADNYANADVLKEISIILLDKAKAKYDIADKKYLMSKNQLNDYKMDEFNVYRDAFYEPPVYYKASAFFAKRYFEIESDKSKGEQFLNEYNASSQDLIEFFNKMSETGFENLGLNHKFEYIINNTLKSKDALDSLLNANENL